MCGWRDSNPHAEAPDPKSGVSTNFTTPAPFEGRKGTRFFSPVNPCVAGVKCAENLRTSRFPLRCGGTKNMAQPGEMDGRPCVGIWLPTRSPNARPRFSPADAGSCVMHRGCIVGKPADMMGSWRAVDWHGFSMAFWGNRGEMEWALGAQTEGSPVWRETQTWLGLGTSWDDRLRGGEAMRFHECRLGGHDARGTMNRFSATCLWWTCLDKFTKARNVGRGRSAAMGRVRAGWSRRLAWAIRHGSCTGWQGVVADPEHGLAHGGLGDPTWGPRRFVDGAVLVVTFSTRDLSLRVAMALGTVKD